VEVFGNVFVHRVDEIGSQTVFLAGVLRVLQLDDQLRFAYYCGQFDCFDDADVDIGHIKDAVQQRVGLLSHPVRDDEVGAVPCFLAKTLQPQLLVLFDLLDYLQQQGKQENKKQPPPQRSHHFHDVSIQPMFTYWLLNISGDCSLSEKISV